MVPTYIIAAADHVVWHVFGKNIRDDKNNITSTDDGGLLCVNIAALIALDYADKREI